MRRLIQFLPRGEEVLPILLITLLILMFIAWPLADIGVLQRPFIGMLMVVVILSGLLTLGGDRRRLATPIIVLGILLVVLQAASVPWPSSTLALAIDGAASLFLTLLCMVLLSSVFGPGRITARRIIGAVVVYLLVPLIFALLFDALERLAPQAFNMGPAQPERAPAGAHFFYLSVITFTTVGFGDMAPVHPVARALVMLEAIFGQMYTTLLLARLVSLEIAHRSTANQ